MEKGVSASTAVPRLFLPDLMSTLIPMLVVSHCLRNGIAPPGTFRRGHSGLLLGMLGTGRGLTVLYVNIFYLLFIPIFGAVARLPPFVKVLVKINVL